MKKKDYELILDMFLLLKSPPMNDKLKELMKELFKGEFDYWAKENGDEESQFSKKNEVVFFEKYTKESKEKFIKDYIDVMNHKFNFICSIAIKEEYFDDYCSRIVAYSKDNEYCSLMDIEKDEEKITCRFL